jgi:ParB family chromosome partitioning protein
MKIPVDEVIVKKRIRQEYGEIELLAESLKRYGQINPIIISKDNVLIAGGRRLQAAKFLGWRTINAIVSESATELERLELEVEENIQRRDFSMDEVAEATQKIYRLKNPSFFRRIWNALTDFFRRLFIRNR